MTAKTCFFIGPFSAPGTEIRQRWELLIDQVVEPATQDNGLTLSRVDTIASVGAITTDIVRHVIEADVVIADLSFSNPNVMYELGLRHASRKPVIHIISNTDRVPLDLASVRTLVVNMETPSKVQESRELLSQFIEAITKNAVPFATPVSDTAHIAAFKSLDAEIIDEPSMVLSVLTNIQERLEALERASTANYPRRESKPRYSRRIFIVHGHDGDVKNQLARFLEKLDFDPVILHERPDRGQTIFAKLRGEMADVGFAFILLTPDDVGNQLSRKAKLNPRARQNVVFEHGLFIGLLDSSRVCAIRLGNVELPSDLQGVLYKTIPDGHGIQSVAVDIANELRAAGYFIDGNRLFEP